MLKALALTLVLVAGNADYKKEGKEILTIITDPTVIDLVIQDINKMHTKELEAFTEYIIDCKQDEIFFKELNNTKTECRKSTDRFLIRYAEMTKNSGTFARAIDIYIHDIEHYLLTGTLGDYTPKYREIIKVYRKFEFAINRRFQALKGTGFGPKKSGKELREMRRD